MAKRSKKLKKKVYIYMFENQINGKMYIGLSSNPNSRYSRHKLDAKKGSGYTLHKAIRKYGLDNFIFEIIEECSGYYQANKSEIWWIKNLKKEGFKLYNITEGGKGTRGLRLFGAANGNYGKEMKPHVKTILLECRRVLTDKQILKIRKLYATGKYTQTKLTEEFNISLTQISRIVNRSRWKNI